MPAPRPRDFLRAELARLAAARRAALRVHADTEARRAVRAFYDRRTDALVDELADATRPAGA